MPKHREFSSPMLIDNEKGLILIGAPRSGLSLLSHCFHLLGIDTGEADAKIVQEIHQQFLNGLGINPFKVAALPEGWQVSAPATNARKRITDLLNSLEDIGKPWLIVNSCLSRLFPLWQAVIDEIGIYPRFVHLIRHPWETAQSLSNVEKIDLKASHAIWMTCHQESSAIRVEYPYVLITLDQLIADPLSVFAKIQSALILEYPNDLRSVYPAILNLVRPSGKNFNAGSAKRQDRSEFSNYLQAYGELCALQVSDPLIGQTAQPSKGIKAKLQKLTLDYEKITQTLSEREKQIVQLSQFGDEQTKLAADRQSDIDQLKRTLSAKAKEIKSYETQITELTQSRDKNAKLANWPESSTTRPDEGLR